MITRRALLAGTAAASLLPATPALAASDRLPVDGSTLPRSAPACLTAAVVAMTVHDGKAYLVTRGIVPPALVELDLATRRVTRTVSLPVGEGGWGITVA